MIYTEYQQVLLTQLQNNDKRIEEIKKEQEEIQGMFLQESKFKHGAMVLQNSKFLACNVPIFRSPFSLKYLLGIDVHPNQLICGVNPPQLG